MKMARFVTMLAFVAMSPSVHADVINGDFQTGDFTGWTLVGSSAEEIVQTSFAPTFVAEFDNGPVTMSQTISTTLGQQYMITFSVFGDPACDVRPPNRCPEGGGAGGIHVQNVGPTPDFNDLTASFAGGSFLINNLDGFDSPPTFPGGTFDFTGVATGNTTTLTFLVDANVQPGAVYPFTLSNISVSEWNGVSTSFTEIDNPDPFLLPEPASGSIFGAAMLGLILRRRSLFGRRLARK